MHNEKKRKLGLTRLAIPAPEKQSGFHVSQDEYFAQGLSITAKGVNVTSSRSQLHNGRIEKGDTDTEGNDAAASKRLSRRSSVQFGDVTFIKFLGKGSTSSVVLAKHNDTGKYVALKKISVFDEHKRHQILREIRALYTSACSTIVKFYGAYFREGCISIVLQYMDRGTLRSLVDAAGARVPEKVLAGIAFQIFWALGYLRHEKRVHRDIKPTNVLLNHRGECKLTDFGLSREIQNSIVQCDTFLGTYKYMSPERIRSQQYSYASDVWGAALMLYELATGSYPFQGRGRTYFAVVGCILEHEVNPIGSAYSTALQELLASCLRKVPSVRPDAAVLLRHPWFTLHGVDSVPTAVGCCRSYFNNVLGNSSAVEEKI